MFDQIIETNQTIASNIEPPLLLEKMGEVKMVPTKSAKVSRDIVSDPNIFSADLPIVGGNMYTPEAIKIFARTVTGDGGEIKNKISHLSFKTSSSGRADYLLPMIFKVKSEIDVIMSTIMTKGSGSLKALKDTGSPFAKKARGEIEGAASISDIRLDAKNSKKLHELGIRTRIALGVYSLDEIDYEGKIYSSQELLDKKIVTTKENLPGIGVFASRSALRIEDIESIMRRKKTPEIDALIDYLIRTTQFDDAQEFQRFYQKHKKVNEGNGSLSASKREEIVTDYVLSLSAILGRQAAKFEKIKTIKAIKGTFGENIDHETPNNVTCLGESVDNSQLINGVGAERIAEFQGSLLNLALSIPSLMEHDTSIAETEFLDAYLDEIVSGWQKSAIEPDFLATIAEMLKVSQNSAKRAYLITKIKYEGMIEENDGGEIKNSILANSVYNLVSRVLDDDRIMYPKTELFFNEYLKHSNLNRARET